MIISHKHKFIFLKTRKTGGTSVELALRPVCGERDVITPTHEDDETRFDGRAAQNYVLPMRQWPLREILRWVRGRRELRGAERVLKEHAYAVQTQKAFPEEWKNYFKFTIERNPWDRQVSWYYWCTRNTPDRPSFDEFLRNAHNRVLRNWEIYALGDRIEADAVIRFEHLAEDFAGIAEKLGLGAASSLGTWKTGIRPKTKSYRDYYTDETRALVAGWYAREIAAFGYEF